jgi:hypothetical protein
VERETPSEIVPGAAPAEAPAAATQAEKAKPEAAAPAPAPAHKETKAQVKDSKPGKAAAVKAGSTAK